MNLEAIIFSLTFHDISDLGGVDMISIDHQYEMIKEVYKNL